MNKKEKTFAPQSEQILLERAHNIAGKSLALIAAEQGVAVPARQKQAKGWIGQLLELALGATAKSRPEPDFTELGIELKTLPLAKDGKPKESTFVCRIDLRQQSGLTWQNSLVKRKLTKVLWVPVEADPALSLGERRIGSAILWSPTDQQEAILQADWQELTDMIAMGELEQISAHLGTYLQIRPKAADGKALRRAHNAQGDAIRTLPRGFYLRAHFTRMILAQSQYGDKL